MKQLFVRSYLTICSEPTDSSSSNVSLCQCDGLKGELAELQQLYDSSQRERAALEQELQRCKAELQKLVGRKSQVRGQRSTAQVVLGVASLHVYDSRL